VPIADEPVDPCVRLAIIQWPADAPRGAMTTFGAEHQISRKMFYAIRPRTDDPQHAWCRA
jgi:putative transposase